jgi:amino acid transporter
MTLLLTEGKDMPKETQLAANSLSIGESIIMGVAGTAPAYSVAATVTPLVAAVSVLAPGSILYCGLIMFGITLAFMHLNKVTANAGASYAWVTIVFGKNLGFFAGWSLLAATAIFMVSGTIPAATALLLLTAPDLAASPGWVTFVAGLCLTAVSAVIFKGIKQASYMQVLMTGIEVLILLAITIGGILHFVHAPMHDFSLSLLSLSEFTPHTFATGALIAIFLYWGWDVTLNLNEETKDAGSTPGWGAFWSMPIVVLLFITFTIAALMALTDAEIQASGTNILFAIADKIFPRPWSYMAVLAVLLSSAGTLETSILQFTRTMFAKGRDNVLHPRYAILHTAWKTPWVATTFIWAFGIVFLFLSSFFPTVNTIIKDSVNVIGFQVAFYYSLTGLACAWYYCKMWRGLVELLGYVIWPIVSALFLIFIAFYSIPTFDLVTNVVGIGGIVVGIIPLLMNNLRSKKEAEKRR